MPVGRGKDDRNASNRGATPETGTPAGTGTPETAGKKGTVQRRQQRQGCQKQQKLQVCREQESISNKRVNSSVTYNGDITIVKSSRIAYNSIDARNIGTSATAVVAQWPSFSEVGGSATCSAMRNSATCATRKIAADVRFNPRSADCGIAHAH